MLAESVLSVLSVLSVQSPDFKAWGCETLDQIRRELYLPESKLYAERGGQDKPSFNWPAGVMLSALAAGAKVEPKYKEWLREYADATRAYWNPAGPVPGYGVLPMPTPKDRYYDDNAWMCLALIETYEVLGDKKYLTWAQDAFNFVWSGWDDKVVGGIYWRENEKKSKNTCSNAPAAACAFRLAAFGREDGDERDKGDRIWGWTWKNLRDRKDGLFWDSISLLGKLDQTKWSYNTALMIRAALERAGRTGHIEASNWYDQGKNMIEPAMKRWFDDKSGAIRDEAPFAHLLYEAILLYSRVAQDEVLGKRLETALLFLRKKNRDSAGHFGPRWHDIAPTGGYKTFRLIDQASAARAFFVAAQK